MYLSSTGSKSRYLTKKLAGSKTSSVKSQQLLLDRSFFLELTKGARLVVMKWSRGKGTKLVWNSFMSTFNSPSYRRAAVMEEIAFAMTRFKTS